MVAIARTLMFYPSETHTLYHFEWSNDMIEPTVKKVSLTIVFRISYRKSRG